MSLKKNIVANLAGSAWTALMSIVFVPIYIKFLGMEAYGLIGIFATLQGVFVLLDLGLGSTINREMARYSIQEEQKQEMSDIARTMEYIYWLVASIIMLLVLLISPYIANHWVNAKQIPSDVIRQSIMLMGVTLAIQWPFTFYSGGLMGLQQQVVLNCVTAGTATLRGGGAVLLLWLVSPSILTFFAWQIAISIVQTAIGAVLFWRSMPRVKSVFRLKILHNIWRFAAGVSLTTGLGIVLTQLDKIILSKILTLDLFGYYTLAGVLASVLSTIVGPFFSTIYPKFSQMVAEKDRAGLSSLYHRSAQFLSVLIIPLATILFFFSREILLLWTHNPTTAEKTYRVLSVLVIGRLLNGLFHVPVALQHAHGWTKLCLFLNLGSVIILAPLIYAMSIQYGPIGAASVWVITNLGYVIIGVYVMHRYLLPKEKWAWYLNDIGKVLAVSIIIAGIGRMLIYLSMSAPELIFSLALLGICLTVASAFTAQYIRSWLVNQIVKFRGSHA